MKQIFKFITIIYQLKHFILDSFECYLSYLDIHYLCNKLYIICVMNLDED